jgi:hypothetical protein
MAQDLTIPHSRIVEAGIYERVHDRNVPAQKTNGRRNAVILIGCEGAMFTHKGNATAP